MTLMMQDSSIAPIQNTGSTNTGNAQVVATLPAVAGKVNWLEGFDITGTGATAALAIEVVVGGLASAMKMEFGVAAGVLAPVNPTGPGIYSIRFPEPLPASAVNTAITVTVPAFGAGNTNAAVTAYGFVK
jgi:hypothetical protein